MRKQKARCDVHQTAYKSRQHSSAYFFFIFVVVVVVNEFEQKKINIDLNWNCLSVVWMSVDDWKNASYLYDYIYIYYMFIYWMYLSVHHTIRMRQSRNAHSWMTLSFIRGRGARAWSKKKRRKETKYHMRQRWNTYIAAIDDDFYHGLTPFCSSEY